MKSYLVYSICFEVEVKTECNGTRAESRFGLPEKRKSPFISVGVSVQSTAGFLAVRVGRERLYYWSSLEDQICFLRVCHYIPFLLYHSRAKHILKSTIDVYYNGDKNCFN